MDKFVIRAKSIPKRIGLRQARLDQLGGVVVLEDLELANEELKKESTTSEEKVKILKRLQQKKPAKEILKSTGIGKTVHRLCRHESHAVSSAASELFNLWKSHVLHILKRKPIEVQSDAETQLGRSKAVKLINTGLSDILLAESIEACVFIKCKRIMNQNYSRVVRKIHYCLKNDEVQQQRAKEPNFDLEEFVNDIMKHVIKVYAK